MALLDAESMADTLPVNGLPPEVNHRTSDNDTESSSANSHHKLTNHSSAPPAHANGPLGTTGVQRAGGEALVRRMEEMLLDGSDEDTSAPSVQASEAAAAMREAVRRLREDASAIAFKIGELHASDASALRRSAALMKQHIDQLQESIEDLEADVKGLQVEVWPATGLFKEAVIAGLVFAVVFGVQHIWDKVALWFGMRSLGHRGIPRERQRQLAKTLAAKNSSSRPHFVVPLLLALGFIGSRFSVETYKRVCELTEQNTRRKNRLLYHWHLIAQKVAIMAALSEPGDHGDEDAQHKEEIS